MSWKSDGAQGQNRTADTWIFNFLYSSTGNIRIISKQLI